MKTVLSVVLALSFSIVLLAVSIYLPATAEWVMLPLMEHFAPPEEAGLPAEEYAPVVNMVTSYLKGDEVPFQHVFVMDSVEYAAFNQKEQHHMADVQGLFALCRRVLYGGLAACGALMVIVLACWQKPALRWMQATLLIELVLAVIVVMQAVTNFDSLFFQFHKIAFTNDLWLLNPQTDLLIRLMPIGFFISYAAIIGGLWLLGMTGLLVFVTIRIKKMQDKGE